MADGREQWVAHRRRAGVAAAVLVLVIVGCSSSSKSSSSSASAVSSASTQSSSASTPSTTSPTTSTTTATGAVLTAAGAIEGAVELSSGFASCSAAPCEGDVTIDGEVGVLTVTDATVHLTMGEDEFEGAGVASGKVLIPTAGTLTFTQLTLAGQGVAAGEEVILDGTASA